MAVSGTDFDPRRALAALMYLVREASDDLYILMKMFYVADKEHLRIAGHFMAGDDYFAMPQGSTPSGAYDLVKFVRGDHGIHRGLPEVQEFFEVKNHTQIELIADVPEDAISEVAKQCLDSAVAQYQEHPNWLYWWRAAHDGAWDNTVREDALAPPISVEDIARTTPDNDLLLAHLADPYPEAAEG